MAQYKQRALTSRILTCVRHRMPSGNDLLVLPDVRCLLHLRSRSQRRGGMAQITALLQQQLEAW